MDPQIHRGTVTGLMAGLRNIFRQPGEGFKRVSENLKGNGKPVGFEKAYLSG
jgi:hypothetical protein